MIKAILAHDLNGAIGQNGDMPWGNSLPKDLEYFKKVTLGEDVVMGRKTFESLPFENGLPNRTNTVLSESLLQGLEYDISERENDLYNLYVYNKKHVKEDLEDCKGCEELNRWLIGGSSIYEQFWDYVEEAHITEVQSKFPEADTFFKPDLTDFEKVGEEIDVGNGELEAYVQVWRRK